MPTAFVYTLYHVTMLTNLSSNQADPRSGTLQHDHRLSLPQSQNHRSQDNNHNADLFNSCRNHELYKSHNLHSHSALHLHQPPRQLHGRRPGHRPRRLRRSRPQHQHLHRRHVEPQRQQRQSRCSTRPRIPQPVYQRLQHITNSSDT
jgi:hypothetical protein